MKKLFKQLIPLLGVLTVFSFIYMSKVQASELAISGFQSLDLETRESSTYDILVPESAATDMSMAGSFGTEPVPDDSATASSTPYSIIGADGRTRITETTEAPFRFIAYLRTIWPDGSRTIGTAWLCGPAAMMTSAHCVYDASRGGYAQSIRVHPGRNGDVSPYDSYAVKKVHVTNEWIANGTNTPEYDFALLNLKTAIGNRLGYFGIRYKVGAAAYNNKHVAIAGYPGENQYELWKMSGSITTSTAKFLHYQIDTTPGQSGSPVYARVPAEFYAIGIHGYGSTTQNTAVRITRKIYLWIHSKR